MDPALESHTDILACPDCRGALRSMRTNDGLRGLSCPQCSLVFPIKEDIFILLPRNARSSALENDLLVDLERSFSESSSQEIAGALGNTLRLINESPRRKTWEWEDEEFWANEYSAESEAISEKNWNDRIWQRDFLIDGLLKETTLSGKTILDCGCGEGQDFRNLMARHCDEATLYVGADISFDGLRLNRKRNPCKNSLYVLCSADWLPFKKGAFDVICYFGILHHTFRKSETIRTGSELLRAYGHMLIHEPLDRPSPIPESLKGGGPEAAHEETVDKRTLLGDIGAAGDLTVVSTREFMTILYGGMMRFFRSSLIRNETAFRLVVRSDMSLTKILGPAIPYFRPREIMLLVRKGALTAHRQ